MLVLMSIQGDNKRTCVTTRIGCPKILAYDSTHVGTATHWQATVTEERTRRPPKRLEWQEVSDVLAYADIHGAAKAAKEFNVSVRTIYRYRAGVREGRLPSVADLVTRKKAEAAKENSSLLKETLDEALRSLKEKLPDATVAQLIDAVKSLGELQASVEMVGRLLQEPSREDGAGADREA